jgi:hypothetical protein
MNVGGTLADELRNTFQQYSDLTTRAFPINSVFFRGGETASDIPVKPRRANVFLSTNNKTCRTYADFWKMHDYSYIFRAVSTREVRLIHVTSMMDCTFRCTDYLGLPRSAANSWQRDELLQIARHAVPNIWIDGIYFEDEANVTEVILDNSGGLIEIVDQIVFRKREEARYTAQIRRVCNSR